MAINRKLEGDLRNEQSVLNGIQIPIDRRILQRSKIQSTCNHAKIWAPIKEERDSSHYQNKIPKQNYYVLLTMSIDNRCGRRQEIGTGIHPRVGTKKHSHRFPQTVDCRVERFSIQISSSRIRRKQSTDPNPQHKKKKRKEKEPSPIERSPFKWWALQVNAHRSPRTKWPRVQNAQQRKRWTIQTRRSIFNHNTRLTHRRKGLRIRRTAILQHPKHHGIFKRVGNILTSRLCYSEWERWIGESLRVGGTRLEGTRLILIIPWDGTRGGIVSDRIDIRAVGKRFNTGNRGKDRARFI